MHDFWKILVLTFVPIFVAIDALGTLPIVLSLNQGMRRNERFQMVNLAMITATLVGLIFLFLGKFILAVLGIEVGHFAIAGGLVLMALSLRDIVSGRMIDIPSREEMVAIVPVGTPLTVGPATITTLLLLSDEFSIWMVLLSLGLNLLAAWLIFLQGTVLAAFLGQGGLRAFSKVASLLLAAIAVKMVVKGIALITG